MGYVPSPITAFRTWSSNPRRRCWRSISARAAKIQTKYYQLRPENIDGASDCQPGRRAARTAGRRDQAAPDLGRADGDLPVRRARFERHRHLRQSPQRQAADDVLDGVLHRPIAGTRSGSRPRSPRRWAAQYTIHAGAPRARRLAEIVGCLEEPLSDSAVLPLWHLCAGTGALVKVALSGEGGTKRWAGTGVISGPAWPIA